MVVLIATPNPREVKRLSRILGGLGHTLDVATTPAEVVEKIRERRPDVAMVCTLHDAWVQSIDQHPGPHIYRIALVANVDGKSATQAWNAGFDDVARTAASPEELAGRVAALERISGWLPTMADDFGADDGFDVLASGPVVELGDTLADEFGVMVGGELTATRALALPEVAYSAEAPLTLALEGKEITLGIGITMRTADAFGTLLFGEPVGRDVMADAMREFANMAGGALKRTALDCGTTYSLGLPVDCAFPEPPVGAPIWHIRGNGIELVAWTATVDDSPRRLTAGMLSEGMVLTQPVLNGSGVLLVQAGAVLTQSTVKRLLELIGPSALVEVARAA